MRLQVIKNIHSKDVIHSAVNISVCISHLIDVLRSYGMKIVVPEKRRVRLLQELRDTEKYIRKLR